MPGTRTTAAPIKEFYGELVTIVGNASAQNVVPVRFGFNELLLYDYEASTPAGFRLSAAPALKGYFYDSASATYIQITDDVFDGNVTGSTGTDLDAWLVTNDFLYIGAKDKFGGIRVDVLAGSPNDEASVLTAKYSKSDGTWASTTITDGTDSSGDTLKVDGNITITTIPSDWLAQSIAEVNGVDLARGVPTEKLFWIQLAVSATLDVDFEISNIYPLPKDYLTKTTGGFFVAATEYTLSLDHATVGAYSVISQDTGTETTNFTWIKN